MADATSAAVTAVVSALCAVVAVAAWRAMLRTGNRAIGFVVAAFVVLSLKNLSKALDLADGSDGVELAFSLADLLAVGLIAFPLLRGRP
jgi:UDP-N-acetylmuramyl pentapeptide phosphotransferase/UDP-N-acetylglucosamine-1-phosphate transferase